MSEKTKRAVVIGLLVVIAVAAAAGVTYYLQQRRIDQLSSEVKAKQAELAALAARADRLDAALQSQTESTTAPADTSGTAADSAAENGESEAPKPEPTTSRQFAFVRKATDKNGKMSLVLDFAQFMTGDAAAKAAAAAGRRIAAAQRLLHLEHEPQAPDVPRRQAGEVRDRVQRSQRHHDAVGRRVPRRDRQQHRRCGRCASTGSSSSNGTVTGGEQQWLP